MPATESDDARIGAQQQAPPEVGLGRDVLVDNVVRWVHAHPAMDRSARSRYTDGIEGDRDLAARDLAARDLAAQSSTDCYDARVPSQQSTASRVAGIVQEAHAVCPRQWGIAGLRSHKSPWVTKPPSIVRQRPGEPDLSAR
jgi:hypothetical protein